MRATRVLALTAVLLGTASGVPSAFAGSRTVKTKVVYQEDRAVVAPMQTDGFNERCPSAAPHAIAGYFGPGAAGAAGKLTLASDYPYGAGDRHWTIGVKNLSDQPQPYIVGVVCVSAAHAFVRVEKTGTIDVAGNDGVAPSCPTSSPYPVGNYFGPQATANGGQFILSQSVPYRHAWGSQFSNVSMVPQAYFAGVVCAPRTAKVAFLTTKQLTLDPAATHFAGGSCGGSTPHAVNGFYAIPASASFGPVALDASGPSGSRGRDWVVGLTNLSQQPQGYFGGVVCIR